MDLPLETTSIQKPLQFMEDEIKCQKQGLVNYVLLLLKTRLYLKYI